MQRAKTDAELAQEASDADFARKLHEEMMAEENERLASAAAAAAYSQQQQQQHNHQQQQQQTHHRFTPPPPQQQQQQYGYSPSNSDESPNHGVNASSPSPTGASGRITCQFCRSQNNIPAMAGTNQFLCGYCKRILIFNQPPQTTSRRASAGGHNVSTNNDYPGLNPSTMVQNNNARGAGGGGHPHPHASNTIDTSQPIFQGNVSAPANIQVRCGQCSVVNAVPKPKTGNTLQFMCGSCQSVNEVNI